MPSNFLRRCSPLAPVSALGGQRPTISFRRPVIVCNHRKSSLNVARRSSPRRPPSSNLPRRRLRRRRATADQLAQKTSVRLPVPGNLFRIMTLRRRRGSAQADIPIVSPEGPPRAVLRPPTSHADVPAGEDDSRPTRSEDRSPSAGSWKPIPDYDPSPASGLSPSRHPHDRLLTILTPRRPICYTVRR